MEQMPNTYNKISIPDAINQIVKDRHLDNYELDNLQELLDGNNINNYNNSFRLNNCKILNAFSDYYNVNCKIDFYNCQFVNEAKFMVVIFYNEINFINVIFHNRTYFRSTEFKRRVDFDGSKFLNKVYFNNAIFHDLALLKCSEFNDSPSFIDSEFYNRISFEGARIKRELDLSSAIFKIQKILNIDGIELEPGAHIHLSLNQIGKYQRFSKRPEKQGYFKKIFDDIFPSILLIEGEDSSDIAYLKSAADQYNILRDNFRTLPSKEEEENRCHYKFKDISRRMIKCKLFKFFDFLAFKWCFGYGIYTKRILFTNVLTIFFFSLIYSLFANDTTIKNYCDGQFNPFYFSVITFSTIGYGDYAPLGWLRYPAGFEGLIGMILTAIFTISFARKFIR